MSLECRPSNVSSDVRCAVCGQGFLLYDRRRVSRDPSVVRATVQRLLREQHEAKEHHADGFTVVWAAGVARVAELLQTC